MKYHEITIRTLILRSVFNPIQYGVFFVRNNTRPGGGGGGFHPPLISQKVKVVHL